MELNHRFCQVTEPCPIKSTNCYNHMISALSWWHIGQFLVPVSSAPVSGASCLVTETMTHFASKRYRQKKNKKRFRLWEFWGWWRYSRCFFRTALWAEKCFHHSTPSFIFVYKQTSSATVGSDWPITVQLSSFRHKIEHALSGTGFWHQIFLAPKKYDRLTSFCYHLTGTRNRCLKLASVSSL